MIELALRCLDSRGSSVLAHYFIGLNRVRLGNAKLLTEV